MAHIKFCGRIQQQRINANDKSMMATASDPDIYINKTKCRISFCTWFHYHLLKASAKGGSALKVVFIKKMGSRQIAVKAFLDAAAVSDDMMLDRWIPDEDRVRQIQENGETDCSVVNLNTGLALQYVW
jgi:hypothetical protein